jgi:8-oxo-dGTP pyrophosphatase MutT (NUDIX family)
VSNDLNLQRFINQVSEKLKKPLPGHSAHIKMIVGNRKPASEIIPNSNLRIGAVLILLYPNKEEWHTVLMKRPIYNGIHSGQISFPGGKAEAKDNSLRQTALRETQEEIGIPSNTINILGKLTELYIPPSQFIVHPYIGIVEKQPDFIPNKTEVDKLIVVSLKQLFSTKNHTTQKVILSSGIAVNTPCIVIQNEIIWGATAMMISELKEIIKL